MENLAGKQIKDYTFQEQIDGGGHGAIYRAYQSSVGREVIVKVIKPELANKSDFVRRFEAEAQIIARLEHPFIVPLHNYWRDPDGAFLVMRYLRGGSLRDYLKKNGALSIEEAVELFSQVAQGLHVAHRSQIIHRDIKPGNILLDEDSNAYLADFGIAKDRTTQESITQGDGFIGSPHYAAPEQARSEDITPQTDIYSLGVVLYEMLVGEHPFPNLTAMQVLFKLIDDPLPEITTLDDSICDDINAVIQKATAKDPSQRYNDILEMLGALREAAQLDLTSTPTSLVELLTPREQEVLQLIIEGHSNRQIADMLVLTEGTIKTYINRLYTKLKVRSRVQAIARARDWKFVIAKPKAAAVSAEHLPEPVNPYKGLEAFRAADAQDYFGREKLIQKLLYRLQQSDEQNRFLALVGPSGSGKSSLAKAGLLPALWRGDLPDSENWYLVDMLPGTHPIDKLESALLRIATDKSINLREQLARDERGLIRVADIILPDDDEDAELLIVIDQFEEVFTLVEKEAERLHFLNLILAAVNDERSKIRVVVTLRADYYDRPLQYPDLGELMRTRVETVLPLNAEELERAINSPATRAGVTFEDGLVSRIVSDVHYQPGALPLLQYALTELFERRDARTLTVEAYQAIGGTGGALAKRADEIYLEGNDHGREWVRQLFLRLVTLGEGAEDTRRRVNRAELLEITDDPELMDEIIDIYARSRLLSLDNDPATRQPTVEVAHEAILREWERLRQWLNDSRDDIRQERQVAQAAEAWQEHNKDTSYLLRGARLEQAEKWHEETELSLTPLVAEFIKTSTKQREAENQAEIERVAREELMKKRELELIQQSLVRTRALVAVFVLAAIISGGFGIFANNQRNAAELERDTQTSILLAALAEDDLNGGNNERGVLLSLEALEKYPFTTQAKSALVHSVEEYRPNQIFEGVESIGWTILDAEWSPDGTRLAAGGGGSTVSAKNSVIIWDVETNTELISVNKLDDICVDRADRLTWSPDGNYIAHISFKQACGIVVWDTTNGKTLLVLTDYSSKATSLDWSTDGNIIASGHEDGTIILWDAHNGDEIVSLSEHEAQVNNIAWSPNGAFFATVSADSTIRIWNANDFTIYSVLNGHLGEVRAVAWSPDSSRIVTGGNDGLPRVWDVKSNQPLFALLGHKSPILALDWSSNGRRIASLEKGNVIVWDATTGTNLYEIPNPTHAFLAFSPNNENLITAQLSEYGQLYMWDTPVTDIRLLGHVKDVTYANWSPDKSMIASVGLDETRIWDSLTGQVITVLPIIQGANAHGSWSPDGTKFATAHQPGDGTPQNIYVWDSLTGDVYESEALPGSPISANWSPDGAYISSGVFSPSNSNPVYLWDATTYESLWTYGSDDINCMQPWAEFSPDSSKLVASCFAFDDTGRNTSARILDVKTGELIKAIEGNHGSIFHAIWSPDGQKILVGYQGVAEVWDAESGETLYTFASHGDARVWAIDWHPDGLFVVSGDTSGVVKVWNSETGEEIISYFVDAEVQSTQWSPDGTQIIIAGRMSEPIIKRVWLSTEELIAHAYDCCVTRELTPEERQQFGLPERKESSK